MLSFLHPSKSLNYLSFLKVNGQWHEFTMPLWYLSHVCRQTSNLSDIFHSTCDIDSPVFQFRVFANIHLQSSSAVLNL